MLAPRFGTFLHHCSATKLEVPLGRWPRQLRYDGARRQYKGDEEEQAIHEDRKESAEWALVSPVRGRAEEEDRDGSSKTTRCGTIMERAPARRVACIGKLCLSQYFLLSIGDLVADVGRCCETKRMRSSWFWFLFLFPQLFSLLASFRTRRGSGC